MMRPSDCKNGAYQQLHKHLANNAQLLRSLTGMGGHGAEQLVIRLILLSIRVKDGESRPNFHFLVCEGSA